MTATQTHSCLETLGINDTSPGGFAGEWMGSGPALEVITPIDGSRIAVVRQVTEQEYDRIIQRAHEAFLTWRTLPAPKRGEIVRQLGNRLRALKADLGQLVTLETGKIIAEGEGEVQEMILATSATVDGEATAHFLARRYQASEVRVSRIARGVPEGGRARIG